MSSSPLSALIYGKVVTIMTTAGVYLADLYKNGSTRLQPQSPNSLSFSISGVGRDERGNFGLASESTMTYLKSHLSCLA